MKRDAGRHLGLHLIPFVAGLLAAFPLLADQPVWSQFPNSPAGTQRHDDIFFITENIGWTVRGTGFIHKTTDGGHTWVEVLNQPGTHFRCIGFADENRGWAGNLGPGSFSSGATDTTPLYETFDGGETWTAVAGLETAGVEGLCAIQVLSETHIFAGGRVRGPAYFIKSTNGGETWSVLNLTALGLMGGIMDVFFHDELTGFLVGMDENPYQLSCATANYHGRILKTEDGGNSWTPVATTDITCAYFWKMSFPSRNVGYASLQQNGSHSEIIFYKTVDGGDNWNKHGIPRAEIDGAAFLFQGIGFLNEQEGWIGGAANTSPYNYNFLQTTDGGATWTPAGYQDSRRINRIRFLGSGIGIASGAKLHIYRPLIAITKQPESRRVSGGGDIVLDVELTGHPPFGFQWLKEGEPIAGATCSVLHLSDVRRRDSGNYSVVTTNNFGEIASSNAAVRVVVPQELRVADAGEGDIVRVHFSDADGGEMIAADRENFEIQYSVDFENWHVLTNEVELADGIFSFEDSLHETPQRFYRVIEF